MRKRTLFLAAGACLATLTLTVGTAIADPTGPPSPRELAGVGAQTTQGVFNDLANIITDDGNHGLPAGTKIIGSYDNAPPGTITTRPGCTITRPNQGGSGTDALVHSLQANDGCVQFARAVTNDSASRAGTGLTYIPFALDALTYAVRDDSTIPRNLTAANLTSIYNCQVPGIQPLLGVFGAGNRTFFLKKLGFTDSPTFAGSPGHACVKDTDSTGAPLLANDGRLLTAPNQLVTYSTAPYLAQVSGVEPDIHGTALLGSINGTSPEVLNSNSAIPQGSNDAIAYAVNDDSSIPKNVSIANLKAIYNCQVPGISPVLEKFGSTVRSTFLAALGLPDSAGFAGSAGHACVKDTDSSGTPVGDNDGRVLTTPTQLVPYSISQYLSQLNGASADIHARAVLGSINSVSPDVLNNNSFMSREAFNVVPTSQIGSGTPINYVFVGPGSKVCANTQTIQNHGFNTDPNCGSTTIQTP
ncbi:MAG: hypothetical protein WCC65_17910 [Pseudonocardiaceae bacterium]